MNNEDYIGRNYKIPKAPVDFDAVDDRPIEFMSSEDISRMEIKPRVKDLVLSHQFYYCEQYSGWFYCFYSGLSAPLKLHEKTSIKMKFQLGSTKQSTTELDHAIPVTTKVVNSFHGLDQFENPVETALNYSYVNSTINNKKSNNLNFYTLYKLEQFGIDGFSSFAEQVDSFLWAYNNSLGSQWPQYYFIKYWPWMFCSPQYPYEPEIPGWIKGENRLDRDLSIMRELKIKTLQTWSFLAWCTDNDTVDKIYQTYIDVYQYKPEEIIKMEIT